MSRPTRDVGASAAALAMRAMGSNDTEGAELAPVDADEKNMAGAGGAGASAAALMMSAVHSDDTEGAVPVANTQGETKGEATYVTPPRPRPPHTHTHTHTHLPSRLPALPHPRPRSRGVFL